MNNAELKQLLDRIDKMESTLKDLANTLEGNLAFSGMISIQVGHTEEIAKLKNWQRDIKSFIAGIVFVSASFGGLATALIHWLIRP
jgi:hypothetical protein